MSEVSSRVLMLNWISEFELMKGRVISVVVVISIVIGVSLWVVVVVVMLFFLVGCWVV